MPPVFSSTEICSSGRKSGMVASPLTSRHPEDGNHQDPVRFLLENHIHRSMGTIVPPHTQPTGVRSESRHVRVLEGGENLSLGYSPLLHPSQSMGIECHLTLAAHGRLDHMGDGHFWQP